MMSETLQNQHSVIIGREFHADLLFWEWAINRNLLQTGEAISAPCYTALKPPAKRHYLSDASFESVGGHYVEKKAIRRYDLPPAVTAAVKRKAKRR